MPRPSVEVVEFHIDIDRSDPRAIKANEMARALITAALDARARQNAGDPPEQAVAAFRAEISAVCTEAFDDPVLAAHLVCALAAWGAQLANGWGEELDRRLDVEGGIDGLAIMRTAAPITEGDPWGV